MPESPIAPYAGLLGLLMIVLSFRISLARVRAGVSLGWGEDRVLKERVRAFGNFAEWVPLALLLLLMAQAADAPGRALHIAGALLLAGRVLHPLGLASDRLFTPFRFLGMVGTYAAVGIAAFYLLRGVAGV